MILWLGGCPKRQERPNVVVYVPTPPAVAPAPPPNSPPEIMVIEEPAPPPEPRPEPEETPLPETAGRKSTHRKPGPSHAPTPAEPDETSTQDVPAAPAAEVPTLESRETSAQEVQLRQQYLNLAQDIRQRLARLNGSQLSGDDHKTLEDARTFYVQSGHAMATGDLRRALDLARKSDLLLAALE